MYHVPGVGTHTFFIDRQNPPIPVSNHDHPIEKLIEKTFIQSGTLLQAIVSPVSNRSNVKGVISRGFTPEIM